MSQNLVWTGLLVWFSFPLIFCVYNRKWKKISRFINVTRTKEERLKNELSKKIIQRM